MTEDSVSGFAIPRSTGIGLKNGSVITISVNIPIILSELRVEMYAESPLSATVVERGLSTYYTTT